MTRRRWFAVIAVLAMTATAAFAQVGDRPEMVLTLSVQKEAVVPGPDGKPRTEWQEVKSTAPGDVLKYTIRYENKGKAEARGARIVDPVPQGTAYIGGSAEGEGSDIAFSLDGKNFESPPRLTYRVRNPDGTETEYVATPDMYTHVLWTLSRPVPPGGMGSVSLQVKVK